MASPLTAVKYHSTKADGTDNAAGRIFTYAAGTTTPQATYTTAGGGTPNANPVILDGTGRASIYLDPFLSYKLVCQDSLGASVPDGTVDNLTGDGSLLQLGYSPARAYADGTIGAKLKQRIDARDYATLAAAVAAIGATPARLIIAAPIALASNVTIPATCELSIENGGVITTTGVTLTINGSFICGTVQCFTGGGAVIFAKGAIMSVLPHWWGAKGDAAVDGSSGTDSTAAFTAAIAASTLSGAGAVSIFSVETGAGNFLVGNLIFPPAFQMTGMGRHVTNFVCKNGTAGKWFTDNGSASKIILERFAMYAHGVAVTHGLQLGRNGVEHGTEGYIKEIWVRDCTAVGAKAIDINSNVGFYGTITAQASDTCLVIGGAPSHVDKIAIMQPVAVGADLSYCDVAGLHIEAPGNSCVPLKITRNCSIHKLSIALANATTIDHLMELNASASSWSIDGFEIFYGTTPAGVTVSSGNFKRADGTFFGGNATAGNLDGNGSYSSEQAGQKLQAFTLRITNTAGTLQHRICTASGVASNFAIKVSGAAAALTNTPTGADGATAMAAGGKIGSVSPSAFYFDTASQKDADAILTASDVLTDTGAALIATVATTSININGVTRTRLVVQFYTASTGVAFAITTGSIAAGKIVQVGFYGYLS